MTKFLPEGTRLDTPENRRALESLESLREAMHSGAVLEARAAVCDAKHNLIVDLGGLRGVIPREEGAIGIDDGSTRDIAILSRVGKPVSFVVTGFERRFDGKLWPVLSRREAQRRCCSAYIQTLRPGDVIPARVTHMEAFGCFVDIGCGCPSLIPIDAISVSRIAHPRDRFSVGQLLRAVVRSVGEDSRVSLSHKELLGTWEENAALFSPGETVAGVIRSVESYGVFVELTPNLAGLAEPKPELLPGQCASVFIKSLLPQRMKVKLILIDAFDCPQPPAPPHYFFEGEHIDRWRYSPEGAQRVIESVFG